MPIDTRYRPYQEDVNTTQSKNNVSPNPIIERPKPISMPLPVGTEEDTPPAVSQELAHQVADASKKAEDTRREQARQAARPANGLD